FTRLAAVMGRPELAEDERYATHSARGANMAELDQLIAAWSANFPAEELLATLHDGGVPAGRIYKAKDMFDDPHFAARDAIVKVPHPDFGELAMQNVVPKLSASPGSVRSAGPALGQHNEEIYKGLLGLDEQEIKRLHSAGVI
ncbi:CoA transferase, partial [Actinomadura adrarensis]